MKKSKLLKSIMGFSTIFLLTSCGLFPNNSSTSGNSNSSTSDYPDVSLPSSSSGWDNYISPSDVTYKSGMANYNDLSKVSRYGCDSVVTTGTRRILVVPLAFTDSTMDTTQVRDDIDTAYNGTAAETGWESVHSYFYESSYQQFNVTATVAPTWFQYSKASSDLGTDRNTSKTVTAINAAVSWYKSTYSSTCTEFDSDNNGLIDCVCVIYAAQDYSTAKSSYENLWAYTYWAGGTPNVSSPVADTFFGQVMTLCILLEEWVPLI